MSENLPVAVPVNDLNALLAKTEMSEQHRRGILANVNDALGIVSDGRARDLDRGVLKTRRSPITLPELLKRKRIDRELAEGGRALIEQRVRERREQLLRRIDEASEETFESLTPYRTLVAWRLVREIGRLRGDVVPDECLNESLFEGSLRTSAWYCARELDLAYCAQKRLYCHYDEAIDIMRTADLLPDVLQETIRDPNGSPLMTKGLALLPPGIPDGFKPPSAPPYRVEDDPRLLLYCQLCHVIGLGLGIYEGSEELPDLGTYGLVHLVDPHMCRELFPEPQALIELEYALIQECTQDIQNYGMPTAKHNLRKRYGLTSPEQSSMIRLCKNQIQDDMGSLDEEKAFMVLKLQDIALRARNEHGDIRAELAANKVISNLLGLDRASNNGENDDFNQVIDVIAEERKRNLIDRKEVPELED